MRRLTLTALVVAGAMAVTVGQAREGGQGRRGGAAPPAQLTIQPVKPGLYAILNPGANTLSRLKVDDLGWNLDPTTLFVRNTSGGFYDEMAKAQ